MEVLTECVQLGLPTPHPAGQVSLLTFTQHLHNENLADPKCTPQGGAGKFTATFQRAKVTKTSFPNHATCDYNLPWCRQKHLSSLTQLTLPHFLYVCNNKDEA